MCTHLFHVSGPRKQGASTSPMKVKRRSALAATKAWRVVQAAARGAVEQLWFGEEVFDTDFHAPMKDDSFTGGSN